MLEKCDLDFSNVEIIASELSLVEVAAELQTKIIIRGIRSPFDVQSEMEFNHVYRKSDAELEFIYLLAKDGQRLVSSSLAKSILLRGDETSDYFPLVVKKNLEEKLLNQRKIIVTGVIASGKSTIVKAMIARFKREEISACEIDFDEIVENIYQKINTQPYSLYKRKLVDYFFTPKEQVTVSKAIISRLVFQKNVKENLAFLKKTLKPLIYKLYREQLKGKAGLIFLNAPLAVEYDLLKEANNQVLFISLDEENQKKYLLKREKLTPAKLNGKIKAAGTNQRKLKAIQDKIAKDKFGKLMIYPNNVPLTPQRIDELCNKMKTFLK